MGKQRQTALILGEGPTEFSYFKSLCDVFRVFKLSFRTFFANVNGFCEYCR